MADWHSCPDPVVFGPCDCCRRGRVPAATAWAGCACGPCMAVRAAEAAAGVKGPARRDLTRRLSRDPGCPWWTMPLALQGYSPRAPVQDAGTLPGPLRRPGLLLVHYVDLEGFPGSVTLDADPDEDQPLYRSWHVFYRSPSRAALAAGLPGGDE